MKKTLLLIPLLLLSCGKSGSSSNSSSASKAITDAETDKVEYSFKFLDEDLYYTLNTKKPLPSMKDSRYINIEVTHDKNMTDFNYETYPEGARILKITALDLRLGSSKTHSVYNLIRKTFDVKKLIILARKVEIFDEIHIAGGDVEIRAEEVYFQGSGKIDTTPVSKTELPENFQDGVNGLSAGDITIVANSILRKYPLLSEDGDELPFLVANGGDGQAAGPGIDGARGRNIYAVQKSNVYFFQSERCEPPRNDRGGRLSALSIMSVTAGEKMVLDCSWSKKEGRPSTSGEDAKVGGSPGKGGLPGKIILSKAFKTGIESHSGKSGKADRLRIGGEAGKPNRVCKLERTFRGEENYYDCITVHNGKNAEPKIVETKRVNGEIKLIEESFINTDYLKTLAFYATDVYKANHLVYAYELLKKINASLNQFESVSFTQMELSHSIQTNLFKIEAYKDFYGHTKTWTPNIAFEVSYKIFEKEMKATLKNLYYVRALMQKSISVEKKKELLSEMQESLYHGITLERANITSFVQKTNVITTAIEDLKIAQDEFQFELRKIEERIKDEAQANLKTPFLNQALKIVSVASKCIPVGQPSFAAIGVAADLLDQVTTKGASFEDIMKDIPNAINAFEKFNWKEATSELDAKLNELDPSVFAKAKDNKERLAYIKNLTNFSSPIYKAVAEQIRAFKAQEVPSSKLDQMIQKIKMKDKSFKRVVAALDKLLQRKKHFVKVTQEFNEKMTNSLKMISEKYIQMAKLSNDNLELLSFENSELSTLTSEIEKNSIERLGYYHYLFSKSYEYRMLTPYKHKFSYEAIADKIDKMQSLNIDSTENNIEELLLFYKSELSDIIHQTITDIEKLGSSHQMREEIRLTRAEEEALNRGEEIFIDLRNVYSSDKNDIRLNSVRLAPSFVIEGAESEIELRVQHSGISLLNKHGKTYLFQHGNVNQPNLTWYSYQGIGRRTLSYSKLSLQEGSLFEEMLGVNSQTKLLTQPGGRTFISLKLRKKKETRVHSICLELDYSFKL